MSFHLKMGRPMTAAERQRKCRANGKGKHRGPRYSRAQMQQFRERLAAENRAQEAAVIAAAAADVRWAISAMAA